MVSTQRKYARLLGLAAGVVAADQVTKQLALAELQDGQVTLIPGWLWLRLTYNPGGAFGFLQGAPVLFLIAGVAIVGVILVWTGRLTDPRLIAPLGLILGGGLGNLADRVFRDLDGRVVDFIDPRYWATFNLADVAIVAGVLLILLSGLRPDAEQPEP